MTKMSRAFLLGFAAATMAGLGMAGAASAQGGADPAALSNGVAAQVLTLDGLRSDARLGGAPESSPLAMAASSLAGTGQGTGIDIPVATARIGGGTDLSLPAGPLGDAAGMGTASMANALGASDPGASPASTVVLGTAQPDLAGALGDQVRSGHRLAR